MLLEKSFRTSENSSLRMKLLESVLEKLVCKIFPEGQEALEEKADMDKLEPRFLDHPALALAQSKEVIESMAAKTLESIMGVIEARREYSKDGIKRVVDLERVIDRYEDKLGNYLFKLTTSDLDDEHSSEVSKDLKVLSDFERMSDHARNIAESIEEIHEKKIVFSDSALKELNILEDAIREITNADTLIVAGTSLAVEPAASFLGHFRGKHLVVLNRDPIPAEEQAELVIRGDVAEVMDRLRVY